MNNFISDGDFKMLTVASLHSEASLLEQLREKYGKKKLEISNQKFNKERAKAALLDGSIDIFIGELDEDKDITEEIIAKDPLVIVTNTFNKVNNLSKQDLSKILSRELNNWQSLNGKNEPILVVDRDILNPEYIALYQGLLGANSQHSNITVNDTVEVKAAIQKFANAISYMSFRDLDQSVKAISVDTLPPSETNINQGYYPLSRSIKLYYNQSKIKAALKKSSLKKFQAFIYNRGQELISELDYMPLTAAERELVKVDSDPVYIGIAVPLEGTYLELAKSIVNAARLAVEDINEQDGINSRPVELIVCNDKANVASAIECANKFVASEVLGVIGHLTSQASIEASKIYVKHKIIQISPASTHPWFTERPGARGYTYRTIARDDKQAELITNLLDSLGLEHPLKVSVFNNGTIYGSTLATLIENAILKKGQDKIVGLKAFEQNAGQYHKEIEGLETNVIIFIGEYGDAAQIVKELALNAKQNIKFIGADGVFSPSFIEEAGLRAEGAYVTGSTLGEDPKIVTEFEKRFNAKYKIPISAFAMNSYDATNILLNAIRASYKNNTTIVEEMNKTKHHGITGKISFNSLGDPNEERMNIYKVIDGKFVRQ